MEKGSDSGVRADEVGGKQPAEVALSGGARVVEVDGEYLGADVMEDFERRDRDKASIGKFGDGGGVNKVELFLG